MDEFCKRQHERLDKIEAETVRQAKDIAEIKTTTQHTSGVVDVITVDMRRLFDKVDTVSGVSLGLRNEIASAIATYAASATERHNELETQVSSLAASVKILLRVSTAFVIAAGTGVVTYFIARILSSLFGG